MENEKRMIDANAYIAEVCKDCGVGCELDKGCCILVGDLMAAPTVDAVVMPKGKPGDFLEWNNGCGFTQIYHIHAVSVYEDCMRYELEKFAPVVNHPCIVRIMSKEEARKEWLERRARERAEEEPTLTACCAKMDAKE